MATEHFLSLSLSFTLTNMQAFSLPYTFAVFHLLTPHNTPLQPFIVISLLDTNPRLLLDAKNISFLLLLFPFVLLPTF